MYYINLYHTLLYIIILTVTLAACAKSQGSMCKCNCKRRSTLAFSAKRGSSSDHCTRTARRWMKCRWNVICKTGMSHHALNMLVRIHTPVNLFDWHSSGIRAIGSKALEASCKMRSSGFDSLWSNHLQTVLQLESKTHCP